MEISNVVEGYKITIGLEIHAELKTNSKMFCGCANSSESLPNINICPICMGHPGTLPVINKEAVRKVLLVGKAVGGKIADFTEFDRKNYFYPDIPKGYQISQYKFPLISGGTLSGVQLTRIHLEEDTARSTHDTPGVSLVDFNRAGVPLMELVTEPVIHSSTEAMNFGKELQLLLQYLQVSDANMEKGEMRVEVNFSVSKSEEFGTKVEIKNINSFRAVGKAIDFEYKRQTALLEKGEKVIQETRGWDENKGITFSQRKKESAHDYRYFPEPDLPKLLLSEIAEFSDENLKSSLPELPNEKRERYLKDFKLKIEDIETFITNREVGDYFEQVASDLVALGDEAIKLASNYITSDLLGYSKNIDSSFKPGKVTATNFVQLITMIKKGDLSSRGAKDVLKIMFEVGGSPEAIANEKDLIQKSNIDEIKKIAEKIINDNPEVVIEYKAGKESLLQFFIGEGMKVTKGSVNPGVLKTIILDLLK
ncbi:Asp-tRNA(Asn)/Glu-tRNA(Gln) amidotransferase subunit GatB [Patescibacteria group bacterium]|nr:Asp-tRNA(Asn)/Glu-tRNA(Gln) amidotransferase subunit GatB [Patescibacteria group bacterium]